MSASTTRRAGLRAKPRMTGATCPVPRAQRRVVELHRHQQRFGGGERRVEQRQALLGGERADAAAGEPSQVRLAQARRSCRWPAPTGPTPATWPADRTPAALGEGVQDRRWPPRSWPGPALPRTAGGRGEQDERRQVEVAGQFVQVPGGVHLRRAAPRRGRAVVQRGDDPVVQHAGGVHDRGQRVVQRRASSAATASRSATSQAATVTSAPSAVSSVASSATPGAAAAPPADQQQVPHAVLGHQMPGHQRAQAAGAAGDQHRALRVGRAAARSARPCRCGGPG